MKSLRAQGNVFSNSTAQLDRLHDGNFERFETKLSSAGMFPLKPTGIEILQINVGKMCNQTCGHCHVDAGPDRKEIMMRETFEQCLNVIANSNIQTVDLTGGAPEMNPDFRWFVEQVSRLRRHIMVRCNLTIINANPKYHDLPEFFAKHKVEVVSSLPHFTAARTDRQRGEGVFERSIDALKKLNEVGYGMPDSDLMLNLVYNPAGAILPGPQGELEALYRAELRQNFGIEFNNLFVITNMPISRFLNYLVTSGNYESYMERLIGAFNPGAATNVMCRNTISVGWEGSIYDCDFNQMLDMKVKSPSSHINKFNLQELSNREIEIDQHCFGCTAGSGSSCGGQMV